MVGNTLSQQLMNCVRSMHDEGILDDHFDHVQRIRNEGSARHFLMTVISIFFNNTQISKIAQITTLLSAAVPYYERTKDIAHFIRGSSSSIGGQRLAMACHELKQGCATRDKASKEEEEEEKMVGITLSRQLTNYVRSKHDEGILDENFDHLRQIQREGGSDRRQFIMTVISISNNDALTGLVHITTLLSADAPDYARTKDFVNLVTTSSERCLELFERVKQEYTILKGCLDNIYQLERAILANETRRRPP